MINDQRSEYITRDTILKMLSDDEVAAVTTAETAARLADGDEYLDLEKIELGVQRAPRNHTPMGRVLPKRAMHQTTWAKILTQLPRPQVTKAHAGS